MFDMLKYLPMLQKLLELLEMVADTNKKQTAAIEENTATQKQVLAALNKGGENVG